MAVITILLILLHVLASGYWLGRALGYNADSRWARAAVCCGLGLVALGFELLVLGHLHLIGVKSLLLSSALMILALAWSFPQLIREGRLCIADLQPKTIDDRLFATGAIIMLAVIAVAGVRSPFATDELQYHWAAPVFWAANSGWVRSPYRLTNGPALAEIIYTFSAVFSSSTAAHWTHEIFLVLLAFACGALANACGGGSWAAVLACLSIPVITTECSVAYNDTAAAALAVAGYAALMGSPQPLPDRPISWGTLVTAGILFAGAASTKSILIFCLPPAILLVFAGGGSAVFPRLGEFRSALFRTLLLVAPVAAALAVWVTHTYSLTHRPWEMLPSYYIVHSPLDPLWLTGGAVGRIPSLRDIGELPLVPFYASVFGQREPYGGRVGLLCVPFSILGIIAFGSLPATHRSKAVWIVVASLTYFLLLGPVMIKTRYHAFVWAMLSPVAAIGYTFCRHRLQNGAARVAIVFFVLFAVTGLADGARRALYGPQAKSGQWFPSTEQTARPAIRRIYGCIDQERA